jgi:pyruvate ferredoxin oxidoreductase beta subunit/2-oxoisovalerate ferredoxin oxidoreductase beta subunit
MNDTATLSERRSHRDDALWRAGNGACAGCGMSLGLQWLDEALGEERPMMVVPACCASVTPGSYPASSYGVPTVGSTFGSAAAVASGVSRVRQLNGEDYPTVCWAGDGGTYDIGVASLSGAAERNEDLIYICYDNEIYGNTGGQRSSATRQGAKTSTTQSGKHEPKKDIMAIIAAHHVPYAATLSLAHRDDFLRKLETARGLHGFRFLVLLSPCPAGWKSDPAQGVELVRMAVGSGLFPLYEVYDGRRFRINARPDGTLLEDYLSRQGRFKSKTLDVNALLAGIADQWAFLDEMERAFPAGADEHERAAAGRRLVAAEAEGEAHRIASVLVEDQPGVLSRVVGQFARRSVNIEDVIVRRADQPGSSVITLSFNADDQSVGRLLGSIRKLVNVTSAALSYAEPAKADARTQKNGRAKAHGGEGIGDGHMRASRPRGEGETCRATR